MATHSEMFRNKFKIKLTHTESSSHKIIFLALGEKCQNFVRTKNVSETYRLNRPESCVLWFRMVLNQRVMLHWQPGKPRTEAMATTILSITLSKLRTSSIVSHLRMRGISFEKFIILRASAQSHAI